jgi:exodeoxyribonuclease V alpha subunit
MDLLGLHLGIEKTAMIRVRAGVSFALTEAMDEGHCGCQTSAPPRAEELERLAVTWARLAQDKPERAIPSGRVV